MPESQIPKRKSLRPERSVLHDFYGSPGPLTDAPRYGSDLASLPADLALLVEAVQGLTVPAALAEHHGIGAAAERAGELHLRRVEPMLDRLLELDGRPLYEERAPERRLVGSSHHPVQLLLATLRAQGVPARARVGFSDYFMPGRFEDHTVCEVWSADQGRWQLVDAELDPVLRKHFAVKFDPLDVPRGRFLSAAEAWQGCRDAEADPARFGVTRSERLGLWFVAGSLVRDLAALNGWEMLPWDVWGAMPRPNEELGYEELVFFDTLADLTRRPDQNLAEIRERYALEPDLRVPSEVYNSLRQVSETV